MAHGQVSVSLTDSLGKTALHYAAEGGDVENVQWLIAQGDPTEPA